MLGPTEEEERLRAEVKSLKDELDKSKRGTLSSQKGHDGNHYQPLTLTVHVQTLAVFMYHIVIRKFMNLSTCTYTCTCIIIYVFYLSQIKHRK